VQEIYEMTAVEMVSKLRSKELSATEAVTAHLKRIEEVNPEINAVVAVDIERAMSTAKQFDEMIIQSGPVGPLHGLPMTHKDSHNTKGIRTTQGSPLFADHVPVKNDLVIQRLQNAGAVSTGKTNVPEFAAGSHTFNKVFGTTMNPYANARSAGGSSGGVAAALASRIQPLGDGSDMGGSVRIPAAFCNVIGLRPSYGVIPMPSPQNPWQWLGRTGPMARTIDDIALFMSATAGPVSELPTVRSLKPWEFDRQIEPNLQGVRIGWSPDFGLGIPVERQVLEVLEAQLQVFEELGAVVEESSIDFSEADLVFRNTRAMNFAENLGDLVREYSTEIKQDVIWNVERGWELTSADWIETTAASARLQQHVRSFYARYDLFLSPGAQVVPFDAAFRYPSTVAGEPMDDYLDWMRSACVLSATSLPVLSMPAGFTPDGLPVGFQVAADHYRDFELLGWAKAYEAHTGFARVAPTLSAIDG